MLTKSCHRNFDYRHGKERNIQLRKQELIAYLPEYNSKMEMKRPLKERERESLDGKVMKGLELIMGNRKSEFIKGKGLESKV